MIGMDFGTTNTGAATFDGDSIHLLPLDPASLTPSICRTSIYITRSRDYYLGSTALNLYFNQNVGRPTRYRKIKVGEIVQIFAELPTFYRDVFVYEDEFSPGRLFLSIKTALRNPNYYGTVFLNNWYSATDLAAVFLLGMKMRIDQVQKSPAREVVLGRPVRFSNDPTEEKVAQSRLLEAAFKAGFEKVYLEYEPVAAALSYERTTKDKEIVLVFDFGGGTLDFTIMEIGDPRQRRVYATGGIPIAGDVFDQRLFRAAIPKHLGENDYFKSGGRTYPIPAHIFDQVSSPQEVLSLNTPENLEMLRSIHQGAIHKEKTHALLRIISSNYALLMFDLIERSKRQLSSKVETKFSFEAEDFSIEEYIPRSQFEKAIRHEYETIRQGLLDTLDRAGLTPKDIQRVIRTGGSSQIPLFVRLLHELFGYNKVQQIDVFSSVTSGLAIRAHEIETGAAALRQYTPDSAGETEEMSSSPAKSHEVQHIDLDLVKRRLEVDREFSEDQASLTGQVLLLVSEAGLHAFSTSELEDLSAEPAASRLSQPASREFFAQAFRSVFAGPDDYVLLATNQFKLISIPVQALLVAQEVSQQSVRDLLRLDPGEWVTACLPWDPQHVRWRLLCLVTQYGQARAFDARLLAEQIARRPYFQLERRYVGRPAFLVPAEEDETLLVGTSSGRASQVPVKEIKIIVYDVLKARKGEEVTAAASFAERDQVLAISSQGLLLPVPPYTIPPGSPPASRGQVLKKNFPIIAFLSQESALQDEILLLSTDARLHRLGYSGKTASTPHAGEQKAVKLQTGERLLSLL